MEGLPRILVNNAVSLDLAKQTPNLSSLYLRPHGLDFIRIFCKHTRNLE